MDSNKNLYSVDENLWHEITKNTQTLNSMQPLILHELERLNTCYKEMSKKTESLNLTVNELLVTMKTLDKIKIMAESEDGFARCRVHKADLKNITESVVWMRRLSASAIIGLACKVAYDLWVP